MHKVLWRRLLRLTVPSFILALCLCVAVVPVTGLAGEIGRVRGEFTPPFLVLQMQVVDVDAWHAMHDADANARLFAGETGERILRTPGWEKHVTVISSWRDEGRLRSWLDDPARMSNWQAQGVVAVPETIVFRGQLTHTASLMPAPFAFDP